MSKFRREEDEADKWLREHDPYYTSSDRDKRVIPMKLQSRKSGGEKQRSLLVI